MCNSGRGERSITGCEPSMWWVWRWRRGAWRRRGGGRPPAPPTQTLHPLVIYLISPFLSYKYNCSLCPKLLVTLEWNEVKSWNKVTIWPKIETGLKLNWPNFEIFGNIRNLESKFEVKYIFSHQKFRALDIQYDEISNIAVHSGSGWAKIRKVTLFFGLLYIIFGNFIPNVTQNNFFFCWYINLLPSGNYFLPKKAYFFALKMPIF